MEIIKSFNWNITPDRVDYTTLTDDGTKRIKRPKEPKRPKRPKRENVSLLRQSPEGSISRHPTRSLPLGVHEDVGIVILLKN